MMTYILLSVPFLLFVGMIALKARSKQPQFERHVAIVGLILVGLTIVFDNLLTGLPVVTYNQNLILGLRLGFAPIEDFGYAIAAAVLVPSLWVLFDHDQ